MRKKQSVIWRGVTEGSWWKVKRSRGVRVPCSAAWRARDSRRGTMTSWKHRPVSSVSSTCWAILWRLWHASTTSSTEKTTPPTPPDQINETTLIQGFIGNVIELISPDRLPVCAALRTSRRTGVVTWTTAGREDTAARADKHRRRTAWWEGVSEATLLSPRSAGSDWRGGNGLVTLVKRLLT